MNLSKMNPETRRLVERAIGVLEHHCAQASKPGRAFLTPEERNKIAHSFALLFWNEPGFDAPAFIRKYTTPKAA